jgi:hypothetical protein
MRVADETGLSRSGSARCGVPHVTLPGLR